jgi:hypothetical protein
MIQLIDDEIRTLRILAGQLPRHIGSREEICIEELQSYGLCSPEQPPRISPLGVRILEEITGAIDFRSRRSNRCSSTRALR